jgi:hypothetical protein
MQVLSKNDSIPGTSMRRDFLKLAAVGGLTAATTLRLPSEAQAQTLNHAMWVHGHSVEVEFPEKLQSIARQGPFTRIVVRPGQSPNWFHFAIPTPVIVSGRRLRLHSVILRYVTRLGSPVRNVLIFDGDTLLAAYDNLFRHGAQRFDRYLIPGSPGVKYGIGISVNYDNGAAADPFLEFISVGADFV